MNTVAATDLNSTNLQQRVERFYTVRDRILEQVRKVIVGQDEVLEQILIALFVGGHCLITGLPGTAKTLMVRTISVLAVPGKPVIRQWPPTNSAMRICSSTSSWPTMTLRTCSRMRSRTV